MFNFQSDFYKFATLTNLAAAGVALYTKDGGTLGTVFFITCVGLFLRAMRDEKG